MFEDRPPQTNPFDLTNFDSEEIAYLAALTPDDVALGTTQIRMAVEAMDAVAVVLGVDATEIHIAKLELLTSNFGAALLSIAAGNDNPGEIARQALPLSDILAPA